ncbi:MAG: hypothetical protein SFV23_14685 [Planctomycetaceae bacterium]|nr:hypothetical protein [Planctomycetaceae bacterium]
MGIRLLLVLAMAGGIFSLSAAAGWSQNSYPRVYGPTGRPYGPTQAHYQYERQYGRPWHGYDGLTTNQPVQHHITLAQPYYPVYYGSGYCVNPLAPPIYGGFASPLAAAPGLTFYGPGVYGSFGIVGTPGLYVPRPDHELARQPEFLSAPLAEAWRGNEERWGKNLPDVLPDPVTRPVTPSSTASRLRSLEAQSRGDEHLRLQEWQLAYLDYKKAVELAEDRGEAHLRLGVVLLILRHYDSAAVALKRAVHVQPDLVQTAPSLTDLLGPDSQLVRSSLAHKLVDYVQVDIRDPDRLFLLGVMMHLDGDQRSREIFEAGLRLAGRGQHFTAFLSPQPLAGAPIGGAPAGNNPALPPALAPADPNAPPPDPDLLPPPAN